MKRIILISFLFLLYGAAVCSAATVIDGTYSGDSTGKWIGVISDSGAITMVSVSSDHTYGESGTGNVSASGAISVTLSKGTEYSGQISGANVTGEWSGPYGTGTISGMTVDIGYAEQYMGQYEGTVFKYGISSGNWQAVLSKHGLISGTASFSENSAATSCIGALFPDGSAIVIAQNGAVMSWQISEGSVTGTWINGIQRGTITGNITGDVPTCRVLPSSLQISSADGVIPKVGSPVTFTATSSSDCLDTSPYYYFSYCPSYGTDSYDSTNGWVRMVEGSGFTTQNSVQHTFNQPGYYVVVVWTSGTASIPSPVTMIGATVAVDP